MRKDKYTTFEVGMVLYGVDKEYERFANIYEIIIKEINDDIITYDRESMGPEICPGHIVFDAKRNSYVIDSMYKEFKRKVWKDEKTTLSQLQKGTFNNIELYGPCVIPPDFDLINDLINQC